MCCRQVHAHACCAGRLLRPCMTGIPLRATCCNTDVNLLVCLHPSFAAVPILFHSHSMPTITKPRAQAGHSGTCNEAPAPSCSTAPSTMGTKYRYFSTSKARIHRTHA